MMMMMMMMLMMMIIKIMSITMVMIMTTTNLFGSKSGVFEKVYGGGDSHLLFVESDTASHSFDVCVLHILARNIQKLSLGHIETEPSEFIVVIVIIIIVIIIIIIIIVIIIIIITIFAKILFLCAQSQQLHK